jgi:hypothetical protein
MSKILLPILFILISCSKTEYNYSQDNALIDTQSFGYHSTTAGNLITTAIQEVNDVEIVLYPNYLLNKKNVAIFKSNSQNMDLAQVESLYPGGEKDQFVIGYMSGRNLKEFIKQRTLEFYALELEVSGLAYEIFLNHGEIISEAFTFEGVDLNDDQFYKIALSKYFIFSSETFPSYKYRNSIDRIFIDTDTVVSAKESLRRYLKYHDNYPLWSRMRAVVTNTDSKYLGHKTISQIQGSAHISPFRGMTVTTKGIVTAISNVEYYPGGTEVYIQSQEPDNNPQTSEGLKLYFPANKKINVQTGDLIEVTGDVYEETSHIVNSLTTTSLRDISKLSVKGISLPLPSPINLKNIPEKYFSTYNGDINLKKSLNLNDGLDFWESLENMRISINSPRIVGFRGGKEQSDDHKSHLTLFLLPNGKRVHPMDSPRNGILADTDNHIHNPQIIPLASGPLTKGLKINENYKIGDIIDGKITGLFTFSKNLFGDAEYVLFTPEVQASLEDYYAKISDRCYNLITNRNQVECRDTKRPSIKADHGYDLTIAAYNVKNLSPVNDKRIQDTAYMIETNLQCPDILGLVEIQDNNGEDFNGDASADNTLTELIKNINCPFKYQEANLDPMLHREGGVPGANIRVALIYNSSKLIFPLNPLPNNITQTIIDKDGNLNFNPGRIGVDSRAFESSRKSLVAQFLFYDSNYNVKDLFIVVNHLNSKLSDTSYFSSQWPMIYPSETKRSRMAKEINTFVRRIELYNPNSYVAVLGDFNEYINRPAMRALEGDILYNLMRDIPKNERYTTNHNGNSQPLDYIFINKNLRKHKPKFEVLHLNSDFLGRLSDHDPVWSGFKF